MWMFGETAFKKSVFLGEIRMFQKGSFTSLFGSYEWSRRIGNLFPFVRFCFFCSACCLFCFSLLSNTFASLLKRIVSLFDPLRISFWHVFTVSFLIVRSIHARGLTDTSRRSAEISDQSRLFVKTYARQFWHFP